MNQEFKIGDLVLITKVGTVTKAEYCSIRKKVMYDIKFNEEANCLDGYAVVPEEIMSQPNQKLTVQEIEKLKERGIQA